MLLGEHSSERAYPTRAFQSLPTVLSIGLITCHELYSGYHKKEPANCTEYTRDLGCRGTSRYHFKEPNGCLSPDRQRPLWVQALWRLNQ